MALSILLAAVALQQACGGGDSGTSPDRVKLSAATCALIRRADIDGDGGVSIFDLTKVAARFGERVPPAPPELDLDSDRAITALDLNLITSVFIKQLSDCP